MTKQTSTIERRTDRMPWTVYREHVKRNPVVFLPAGSLEQHGPHLPMGCDAIFAEAIARLVAEALDGLVMPPLAYGYKSAERSGGGQTFPGTTSLDGQTLSGTVRDILREVVRHGVRKVVVVNGHVENQWFLTEGIDLALRECQDRGQAVRIIRCEYWNYTPKETLQRIFEGPFPGVDLEHAALLETSMMLALHPELVDTSAFPPNLLAAFPRHDRYPGDGRNVPDSGVLAPVNGASAEKGRILIDATVAEMISEIATEFSL